MELAKREGEQEMLTVETIRKIRLSVHRDGKSIRETAKNLNLARNTVRKAIRSEETRFEYERRVHPRPRLGAIVDNLEKRLCEDQDLPKRRRRTAQVLYHHRHVRPSNAPL